MLSVTVSCFCTFACISVISHPPPITCLQKTDNSNCKIGLLYMYLERFLLLAPNHAKLVHHLTSISCTGEMPVAADITPVRLMIVSLVKAIGAAN